MSIIQSINQTFPEAKTNEVHVIDNVESAIKKLVAYKHNLNIGIKIQSFPYEINEKNKKDYGKTFHRIVKALRGDLPDNKRTPMFSVLHEKDAVKVVYVTTNIKDGSSDKEIIQALLSKKQKETTVLKLILKLLLQVKRENEILFESHFCVINNNFDLYTGIETKEHKSKNATTLNALKIDFYISQEEISDFGFNIQSNLVSQSYSTKYGNKHKTFLLNNEIFYKLRQGDGRYFFHYKEDKYEYSKFFQLMRLQEDIASLFNEAGITFEESIFHPTHYCSNATRPLDDNNLDFIIINNSQFSNDEIRHFISETQETTSPVSCIKIRSSQDIDIKNLSTDCRYLVINDEAFPTISNNSQSEEYSTTLTAFNAYKEEGDFSQFDFYTQMKIHNIKCFLEGKDIPFIMQGLKMEKDFLISGKNKTQKMVFENICKKLNNETYIKDSIIHSKTLSLNNKTQLQNYRFSCLYVNKIRKKGTKSYDCYGVISDIIISHGELIIENILPVSSLNYLNEERLQDFHVSELEDLQDGDFIISNLESREFLKVYKSNIKQIIGNNNLTTDEISSYNSNLSRKNDNAIMPFYIFGGIQEGSKNNKEVTLIEHKSNISYIFNTSNNPLNQNQQDMRRIYGVQLFKEVNGCDILDTSPSNSETFQGYLSLLTIDFLSNGNVSRCSILEKITKTPLLN